MVTTTTASRRPVLNTSETCDIVVSALQWLPSRDRILLHAYSLMPDHVHAIVTIRPPHSVSRVLHSLKSYTASRINAGLGHAGPLWAEGFHESAIRGADQMRAAIAYVLGNPVRADLVAAGQQHPYTRAFAPDDASLDRW